MSLTMFSRCCFSLFLASCLFLSSCYKQDLFNKELYRQVVRTNYPVDTLGADHPWTLLQRVTVPVFADIADNSIAEVRIYDTHPLTSPSAEMVARADISPGGRVTMTFDVAKTQGDMYAVLVGRSGKSYVTPFYSNQGVVNFSGSETKVCTDLPEPRPQTFTYVYESSFPTPDDFDYNDLVMRISRTAPQPNILQLRVTLSAVGCFKKIAGAIRLPGIRYDDVEYVDIEGGESFIEDYPQLFSFFNTDSPLDRSRNGEAVVCLFEDAHFALSRSTNDIGVITHVPYNTVLFPDSTTAATVDEQTRTYNIYLKLGVDADSILLADLDPFIIENYNEINFEVHTYQYKFSEVLWEYLGSDKQAYDDYLAWALLIPSGTFRYPVEEMPLGTYRNGELYGAYGRRGHSFGEWARDYRIAYDWWLYPNASIVY